MLCRQASPQTFRVDPAATPAVTSNAFVKGLTYTWHVSIWGAAQDRAAGLRRGSLGGEVANARRYRAWAQAWQENSSKKLFSPPRRRPALQPPNIILIWNIARGAQAWPQKGGHPPFPAAQTIGASASRLLQRRIAHVLGQRHIELLGGSDQFPPLGFGQHDFELHRPRAGGRISYCHRCGHCVQ